MAGRPREFSEEEIEQRVILNIKINYKIRDWFKRDCFERGVSMRETLTGWIESYKKKSEAYWKGK